MRAVILSAGKSTRFTHAGLPHQKSLLKMPDGKTLLEWQVDRIKALNPSSILYISREEYKEQESKEVSLLDIMPYWIKRKTKGPLHGLFQFWYVFATKEPVIILYNDELINKEILLEFVLGSMELGFDSAVVCFENNDERFSRIPKTNLACGCTYYFKTGWKFLWKLLLAKKEKGNGVPDIVYSFNNWSALQLLERDYVELGTAEEFRLWAGKQGMTKEDMDF